MEIPSASKYLAADRSHDVRGSVRDDIRVDDEREHQRFHQGTSGRGPAQACRSLT